MGAYNVTQVGSQVIPGDIYKLNLYAWFGAASQMAIITPFFRATDSITFAGVKSDELAKSYCDQIKGDLCNLMSSVTNFRGCRAQAVKSSAPIGVAGIAEGNDAGQLGPNALTNQTGLVSYRGDIAGPKYRGRLFIPWPDASVIDVDGTPLAAYVTLLDSLRLSLFGDFTVVGVGGTQAFEQVIWHRASRTADAATTDSSEKAFGQQHRRGNFGKRNVPYIPR